MDNSRFLLLSQGNIAPGKTTALTALLEECIARRARGHALMLYNSIRAELANENADFKAVRTWQILIWRLRTFLGDNAPFWRPLVEGLFGTHPPIQDKVWDIIIPIGFKHLHAIKASIPLTHEGIKL